MFIYPNFNEAYQYQQRDIGWRRWLSSNARNWEFQQILFCREFLQTCSWCCRRCVKFDMYSLITVFKHTYVIPVFRRFNKTNYALNYWWASNPLFVLSKYLIQYILSNKLSNINKLVNLFYPSMRYQDQFYASNLCVK